MLANIAFYQNNQESLKQVYGGRYLLIAEEKVIGAFFTWSEACSQGLGILREDTFLVKYCS